MSDVGYDGKLKIVPLLDSLGDCEQFQIDSMDGILELLKQDELGIYVCARQVDIEKMPSYGEQVKVVTYVYELGKSLGYRNTFMYDEKGQVLVRSYATGAFVDLSSQKMVRVPEHYWEIFSADDKQEMNYLPRKVILPALQSVIGQEFTVPDNFIDSYGHMNNVKYAELALSCVENGLKFDGIRAEYKMSARAGDKIIPKIYSTDGHKFVSLTNKEDKIFANIELRLKK